MKLSNAVRNVYQTLSPSPAGVAQWLRDDP